MPPRFYLPPQQCSLPALFLAGREAHHALKVLRMRPGDQLLVLDGQGREFQAQIESFDRDKARLQVTATRTAPPPPSQITLLQALPKGKIFESIIQKATELGVSRIVPLLSERVVGQFAGSQAARKSDKWQLTAIEAIKQCGSPWLPEVEGPSNPEAFIRRGESFDLSLLGSLQPGSRNVRHHFQAFLQQHDRLPRSVAIWIGPEGDFSPSEIATIQASAALPITFGPLVLRVETAAVFALSVINHELQAALAEKHA